MNRFFVRQESHIRVNRVFENAKRSIWSVIVCAGLVKQIPRRIIQVSGSLSEQVPVGKIPTKKVQIVDSRRAAEKRIIT